MAYGLANAYREDSREASPGRSQVSEFLFNSLYTLQGEPLRFTSAGEKPKAHHRVRKVRTGRSNA